MFIIAVIVDKKLAIGTMLTMAVAAGGATNGG